MKYTIRSLLVFSFFIIFLLLIFFYISILQIYYYKYYQEKSISNYTRLEKIEGLRGIITDCNDISIAITKPSFKLFWHKYPKLLNKSDYEIIAFLEELYHTNIDIKKIIEETKDDDILLQEDISFENLSAFLEQFPDSKRINIIKTLHRNYPHEELFCHAIGYINKNKNGLFGLEKIYNNTLTGKEGLLKNRVNAKGEILTNDLIEFPEEGELIKTTLDFKLQQALFNAFPKNESGCAIIIDPLTGAIKALLSFPVFNPHIFQKKISHELWQCFQNESVLINRVFQAQYAPGSIYKLIISLALLEEKIITTDTQWFCNGHVEYKGRKYHCNKRNGHGLISINEAIAHSCNIPYYLESINHLGIDTIYKYATSFGLGKKTGIFTNELEGLIPNRVWKKKTFGTHWYTGETLSVAIGQGATTVTPIQVTQLIMGIMHGYIIPPYILQIDKKEKTLLPYKKENLQIIKNNMKISTIKGSSKKLSQLNNWEFYAKTGTSQVRSLDNLNLQKEQNIIEKKNNHNGLFACWAKYKNEKPMIVVIVIENNGSSRHTVEVAKNFFLLCEKNYATLNIS